MCAVVKVMRKAVESGAADISRNGERIIKNFRRIDSF